MINIEENNKLYMPSDISKEKEIFTGMGKKEIQYFSYLFIFNLILVIIISIFLGYEIGILLLGVGMIVSYGLVVKNPNNNSSTIKQLSYIYKFLKEQKIYKYKYKEWWENYLDEEKG